MCSDLVVYREVSNSFGVCKLFLNFTGIYVEFDVNPTDGIVVVVKNQHLEFCVLVPVVLDDIMGYDGIVLVFLILIRIIEVGFLKCVIIIAYGHYILIINILTNDVGTVVLCTDSGDRHQKDNQNQCNNQISSFHSYSSINHDTFLLPHPMHHVNLYNDLHALKCM